MLCLKGRRSDDTKFKEATKRDDFGWWLSSENDLKSPRSTQSKGSLGSSESMLSCIDSDDSESYFFAQEFKQDCHDNCEKIELTSLIHEDLDVNSIEQDASRKGTDVTAFAMKNVSRCWNEVESQQQTYGVCYTPERLVRSQRYRILTPSPPYLSISHTSLIPRNENLQKMSHSRRRLNYTSNDSTGVDGMQPKAVSEHRSQETVTLAADLHDWGDSKQVSNGCNGAENHENEAKKENILNGSDDNKLIGKRHSYERLNVTWENCGKMGTRSSSLEDTSGIQSNDWSSDTHSDLQHTPLSLCDELATTNYKLDASQEQRSAINEVVSILEVLDTDPDKAAVLLEEDRFCDSTSSHDQLTRLALTIETDANVPGVPENPEPLVQHLTSKVKRLQANSKDIYRDIFNLRKSFQCDEQRIAEVSSDANKLRQEVRELRYFDDLLKLLRGELERISKRNWPFVIGRTNDHPEEMDLIV